MFIFLSQVDDIEDKLDRLIGLYEEDRKRFAQIPFGSPHCPPCTPLAGSPSPPYINQVQQAGHGHPQPQPPVPGGHGGQQQAILPPSGHIHQNSVTPLVVSAAPQMQHGRPRPILVDPAAGAGGSNPALAGGGGNGHEDASGTEGQRYDN